MEETQYLAHYDSGNTRASDSQYLAHFGVKGMRWGVRKDRQRHSVRHRAKMVSRDDIRYASTARGDKIVSMFQDKLKQNFKVKRMHTELSDARKSFYEQTAALAAYNNDAKLVAKYAEKAAHRRIANLGIKDPKVIRSVIDGHVHGDMDQGDGNSFELYCQDKGLSYKQIAKQYTTALQNYRDECSRKVRDSVSNADEVIGQDLTSKKVGDHWDAVFEDVTMGTVLTSTLVDMMEDDAYKNGHYLPT